MLRTSKENREGSSDFLNSKPLPILKRAIEDVDESAQGPHLHRCAFLRFCSHIHRKRLRRLSNHFQLFLKERKIIAYRRGATGRRC